MLQVLEEIFGPSGAEVVDSVQKQAKFSGRITKLLKILGQAKGDPFIFFKGSLKGTILKCIMYGIWLLFSLSSHVLRTNLRAFEEFLKYRYLLLLLNGILTAINCPIVGAILLSGNHGFDVPIFGVIMIISGVYATTSLFFLTFLFLTRDISVEGPVDVTKN